jgi:putative tricarboxylic transport membrane protein
VRLLRVPYRLLYPMILMFCCIGVYSLNTSTFEIMLALAFGLFGYWLYKHDFEAAPLLLGFILGPMMEESLRKAMSLARGDVLEILMRPLTGTLLALAAILLVAAILPTVRKQRETVFVE